MGELKLNDIGWETLPALDDRNGRPAEITGAPKYGAP